MQFRKDINGLRAIAVIAVVLFHFNASWLPGGFAGVDVFFVISGFLMTGIVFRGMEKGDFSIFKFYLARTNRIMPAMVIMIILVMIVGFFFINPVDFREMSIYAIVSTLFVSNLYFFKNVDYFNPNISDNIFVHTWSLSAEWQFYILYPLIIMVIKKIIPLRNIKLIILLLCITGFIYNIHESIVNPNASYYLLSSRAWEMLVGACAYLFTINWKHERIIKPLSLLVMIGSFLFISKADYWPGYMSAFPVIASFLFISCSRPSNIENINLLNFIGYRSYSLYLWHWPIVSLMKRFWEPSMLNIFLGLVLTFIMTEISFKLFEKRRSYRVLLSLLVILMSFAFFGYKTNGMNFKSLTNPEANSYLSKYSNYKKDNSSEYGVINKLEVESNYTSIFLWGDSHAEALAYGLGNYLYQRDIPFRYTSSGNCMAGIGIGINVKKTGSPDYDNCVGSNKLAIDFIKNKKPKMVIFSQRDEHDVNDFEYIINTINDNNIKYVVVGPVPQWKGGAPLKVAYEKLNSNDPYMDGVVSHLFSVDHKAKSKLERSELNVTYISLLDDLCLSDNSCISIVDENKSVIHWDNSHLSLEGSRYIVNESLGEKIVNHFN